MPLNSTLGQALGDNADQNATVGIVAATVEAITGDKIAVRIQRSNATSGGLQGRRLSNLSVIGGVTRLKYGDTVYVQQISPSEFIVLSPKSGYAPGNNGSLATDHSHAGYLTLPEVMSILGGYAVAGHTHVYPSTIGMLRTPSPAITTHVGSSAYAGTAGCPGALFDHRHDLPIDETTMFWTGGSLGSLGGGGGGIGGEGSAGHLAIWSGATSMGADAGLTFDATYDQLRISTSGSTPGTGGDHGIVAESDNIYAPPQVNSVYSSSDYPDQVGPIVGMFRARGTSATPTTVKTDDDLGDITWGGLYTTPGVLTGGWYKAAKLRGVATEDWDDTHQGTKLLAITSENGSGTNRPIVEFGEDGNLYRVTDGDRKKFPYIPATSSGLFLRDDDTWQPASGGGMVLDSSTPQSLGIAASGSSASGAHGDHIHDHGNLVGGSLHALAVDNVSSGFISGTDAARLHTLWVMSVAYTRTINTTYPLTGGGDLSGDLTLAISAFTSASPGVVPAPGASSGKFLRDDATWQTAAGITADAPLTGNGTSGSHLRLPNFSAGSAGAVPGPAAAQATEWDTLRGSGEWYFGNKRTIPAGVAVSIPADSSVVVSSYFSIAAGGSLTINAGASLEIR